MEGESHRVSFGEDLATELGKLRVNRASTDSSYVPQLPLLPETGYTQSIRDGYLYALSKQLLPSILTIFLGSIFVVVRPIAFLAGSAQYTFLLLVAYVLFFHSGEHTLGKQIQLTTIGVIGAVCGIGMSALAIELGCIANRQANSQHSVGSRAAHATLLAFTSLVAGYLKSRFPRLSSGCMLAIFTSIWLTGISVVATEIRPAPFLDILYAMLFAAGLSILVVAIVFPATANGVLARKLVDAYGTASELLLASLHLHQLDYHTNPQEYLKLRQKVSELRHRISSQGRDLRPAFEEARFEIIFSRFRIERYEIFMKMVLQLQTILVSRTGLDTDHDIFPPESRNPAYLRKLVDELGTINLACLNLTRNRLASASSLRNITELDLGKRCTDNIDKLHGALQSALGEFRTAIVESMDEALQDDSEQYDHTRLFRANAFRDCFFFTSLVELSEDVAQLLLDVEKLPQSGDGSRRKLWFPALSLAFARSRHFMTNNGLEVDGDEGDEELAEDRRLVKPTAVFGMHAALLPFLASQRPRKRLKERLFSLSHHKTVIKESIESWKEWLSSPKMYKKRVQLHTLLATIRHSRHLKHGIKCALGISLLTLPGHLPVTSPGYQWFESTRGPWIAISFVCCLQTTTAATYRDAVLRTIGTILGAIYGVVGQRIAHQNPYALVAVMTFQAPFTNYLMLATPAYSGIGLVSQITVPAIIFVPYLGLPYDSVTLLGLQRAQDIEIGILAALFFSTVVWPYHARVQLVITCAKATDRLTKLYLSMSKQVLRKDSIMTPETKASYEQLENVTQLALDRSSALCRVVHLETSLLPKPVKQYQSLITALNELLNLFSGLRSIREHIPRKMTVADVLPQRTELVSSILITLHAISHSLHNHSPVPQFLPNPRAALESLIGAIEEHIEGTTHRERQTSNVARSLASTSATLAQSGPPFLGKLAFPTSERPPSPTSPTKSPSSGRLGFSFAFALAENEAISEVVDKLDDILETCKNLYGVATFIEQQDVPNMSVFRRSYIGTPVRTPTTRSVRQSFSTTYGMRGREISG